MAAPFDTLDLVQELESAGFDQKQAEGLVHGLAKALSKYDLATKQDLGNLEVSLRSYIEKMEVSLRAEIDGVKRDIGVLKWLMSVLIFGVVLLLINAYWVG